jgi:hemolysin activation/secretion protein
VTGSADIPILGGPRINGFVIWGQVTNIITSGVPGVRGVDVRSPQVLKVRAFKDVLTPFLGRTLTVSTLGEIQTNIVRYFRMVDLPVVDVFFQNDPETVVVDGVVQIAVVQGQVGQIRVVDANKPRVPLVTTNAYGELNTNYVGAPYTNGWFSFGTIRGNVHLNPGDWILQSKLLDDVNWLNRNPFREVSPAYIQGDVGKTDVELRVNDGKDILHPLPLRVFAGGDDSGNNLLGNYHAFAGFNWGNAFGLDDQLNYTYTTDTDFYRYKVHSGSYVAPLPWWHNTLTLFGYYAEIKPDLSKFNSPITENGTAFNLSARYAIPIFNIGHYEQELSLGVDYKYQNNNSFFDQASLLETPTTVSQGVVVYRGSLSDTMGETAVSAQGFYSPGHIGGQNDPASYNASRGGTKPDYYYANLDGSRSLKLPLLANWRQRPTADDFSFYIHGNGQYTTDRLLPSEQLGLGGWASVRGYDERIVSGDKGLIVNNELRSPTFKYSKLGAQLYGFYDYGDVKVNHYSSVNGDTFHSVDMASTGPGLRVNWGRNLEARADYGFQLRKVESSLLQSVGDSNEHSRLHFSVTASF